MSTTFVEFKTLSVGKGDLFSVLPEIPTKRSAVGMSSAETRKESD